jgi:hypothetical protein
MKVLKKSLKDSFNLIQEKTNFATRINDGFKRQLMEYEKELFNITENTHNFFPKRKRVENYNEKFYKSDNNYNNIPSIKDKEKKAPRKYVKKIKLDFEVIKSLSFKCLKLSIIDYFTKQDESKNYKF